MERRIEARQMLGVWVLFLIAQFIGLAFAIFSYVPQAAVQAAQPSGGSVVTYILFLALEFAVVIVFIMWVVRSYRGGLFFVALEAYMLLLGGFFFFSVIVSLLPYISNYLDGIAELALPALLAVLLFYLWKKGRMNKNVMTIVSSVGLGLFLGANIGVSFGFWTLYIILGFFAVYDYFAVFVFKFMIPFAKQMSSRNLAFMIGSSNVEIIPKESLSREDMKELRNFNRKQIEDPVLKRYVDEGNMPAVSSVMLGNGDIMLPLTVAAGAYFVYANAFLSLMIIFGSAAGLIATMLLLKRYKVGLPAIPPLFAFISFSVAIAFLFYQPFSAWMIAMPALLGALSLAAILAKLSQISHEAVTVSPSL